MLIFHGGLQCGVDKCRRGGKNNVKILLGNSGQMVVSLFIFRYIIETDGSDGISQCLVQMETTDLMTIGPGGILLILGMNEAIFACFMVADIPLKPEKRERLSVTEASFSSMFTIFSVLITDSSSHICLISSAIFSSIPSLI